MGKDKIKSTGGSNSGKTWDKSVGNRALSSERKNTPGVAYAYLEIPFDGEWIDIDLVLTELTEVLDYLTSLSPSAVAQIDHYESSMHRHSYFYRDNIIEKDCRIYSDSPVQLARKAKFNIAKKIKMFFKRVGPNQANIDREFVENYNRGCRVQGASFAWNNYSYPHYGYHV